jgi:anti-sigma regulatory factor (Ser/Thr protein kinase)
LGAGDPAATMLLGRATILMTEPLKLELPRERDCAVIARRWLEQHCREMLGAGALDDLKLIATELVNNAYVHGRGRIRLILETSGQTARVEVVDEGEDAVLKIKQRAFGAGGNGLRLVDAMSTRWGAFEGTTHVWAELPADSDAPERAG